MCDHNTQKTPCPQTYDNQSEPVIRFCIYLPSPEKSVEYDARLPIEKPASLDSLVQHLNEQLRERRPHYHMDERTLGARWMGANAPHILDTLDDIWLCGARAILYATAVADQNGAVKSNAMHSQSQAYCSRRGWTRLMGTPIVRLPPSGQQQAGIHDEGGELNGQPMGGGEIEDGGEERGEGDNHGDKGSGCDAAVGGGGTGYQDPSANV